MICCKCKREINKSAAAYGYLGNYCQACADALGYTTEQQAERDFAECLTSFKKAMQDFAQSLVDGLNGKKMPEKAKPKIDRCEGCIHRSEYRDMSATTPICRKGGDLVEAAKMRNEQSPCKYKMTWKNIDEMHEIPTGGKWAVSAKPNKEIITIIRCKNCRLFNTVDCAVLSGGGYRPTENDFCSFAERKGQADNEKSD